jgi:glycoside/pentoside/hexuronide:cation symporter, GPH family
MLQSMIADACEYEERMSGSRRDALLGAFITFSQKAGVSAAFIFGGLLLNVSGFDANLGGRQPDSTLLALRIALAATPIAFMLVAMWLARGYPLGRAEMNEVRAVLLERQRSLGASQPCQ